ncbi:MAG: DNA polymerase III subunit alpha, partial [Atopobiaceae bacterium]|nr:DNA polymerase III subunit alpha [Atopobiaceae bacterium]
KHVVALIALYRPGPIQAGMIQSYVNRMHGKESVVSYDPRLSTILEETYGTLVYQEQVMQISVAMCGFSAGESDSRIRKPVAKKHIEMLNQTVYHWEDGKDETTYDHWMNGAVNNGYTREIAQQIWDDVLEFASYAFNKSHSAGYAILVMQTAWLKAHYPREYMAAVLTSYMGKTDRIVHYINSCRHEGIAILPPDINESGRDFTATAEGIRFGFAGIRGVGEGVSDVIIEERRRGGPFKNLHDFCERVDSSQANRRVVEALIKSGAFDSCGYTRMQLMHFIDKNNPENALDAAAKRQKDRAAGQFSMFDMFADVEGFGESVPEPDGVEWDRHTKLAQEKDVLGIYVSDHPLAPYEYALSQARDATISGLSETYERTDPVTGTTVSTPKIRDGQLLWVAGMVSDVRRLTTKNGEAMAVVTLEDMEGEVNCVCFPKTYTKKAAQILSGQVDAITGETAGDVFVRMQGRVERDDRGTQVIVSKIESLHLDDVANQPKVLEVLMSSKLLSREVMERLSGIFGRYRGMDRVELRVEESTGDMIRMELPTKIDAGNRALVAEVVDLLGSEGRVAVA